MVLQFIILHLNLRDKSSFLWTDEYLPASTIVQLYELGERAAKGALKKPSYNSQTFTRLTRAALWHMEPQWAQKTTKFNQTLAGIFKCFSRLLFGRKAGKWISCRCQRNHKRNVEWVVFLRLQGSGSRGLRRRLWRAGGGNTRGTQSTASGGQGRSLTHALIAVVFREIQKKSHVLFFWFLFRLFLRFAPSKMSWTSSWRL